MINGKRKKLVHFGGSLQSMALKTCLMQQLEQEVHWGGKEKKSDRPCLSVDLRDAGRQTNDRENSQETRVRTEMREEQKARESAVPGGLF